MLVKSCEESVLHAPHEVLVLLTHAYTIDKVKMREGQHNDLVVVLDEREAVTKLTIVDVVANTTNSFS